MASSWFAVGAADRKFGFELSLDQQPALDGIETLSLNRMVHHVPEKPKP